MKRFVRIFLVLQILTFVIHAQQKNRTDSAAKGVNGERERKFSSIGHCGVLLSPFRTKIICGSLHLGLRYKWQSLTVFASGLYTDNSRYDRGHYTKNKAMTCGIYYGPSVSEKNGIFNIGAGISYVNYGYEQMNAGISHLHFTKENKSGLAACINLGVGIGKKTFKFGGNINLNIIPETRIVLPYFTLGLSWRMKNPLQ